MLNSECFTDIDRHFARFMERLCGGPNCEVLLAAALASRNRGLGNICLNLPAVAGSEFSNARAGAGSPLRLPTLDDWVAALRKSPVVGKPSEFKPLILDASNRLYLQRYWRYEDDLAKTILHRAEQKVEGINVPLLREGLERLFPAAASATETDWQRVAAETAVTKHLCVISGGPGTGKTHTVVSILALLLEQAGDKPLRVALAAPTGKAAARLQESLKKWKTTLLCTDTVKARLPEESFTLHRLLGGTPDSAKFKHDETNPLPFDVVVVDEASMVDLALMAKLFAATSSTARLILLGDKDQLASVEAGEVLGDICHREPDQAARPLAGCIVELRRNYRFDACSGILALSQAINAGDTENALRLLKSEAASSESIVSSSPPSRSAEHRSAAESLARWPSDARRFGGGILSVALPSPAKLKEELRPRVLAGFGEVIRARDPADALRALNRFHILCAVRQGPYGVETVNRFAEEILVEAGLISAREWWYAGRPVLVTRNDPALKLFNGDIGVILPDPATGELRAWFAGADNSPRGIPPIRLPEHETVFAMTVHKSQGSEFEEVLLLLPDRDSPLLTRELVYTAVTRASRRVELWFEEPAFSAAVSRRVERASGLGDALWGGVKS